MLPALLEVLLDAWMGIHLCWTCGVSIICVGMQEKHLLDSGLMWLCRCHHGQDQFKHVVLRLTIALRPVTSRDLLIAYGWPVPLCCPAWFWRSRPPSC